MKKQQVFYIHGGNPYIDYEAFLNDIRTSPIWDLPDAGSSKKWNSTLREDLGENYEVFMPQMPNKQNAKYEEWKIWFERYFEYIKDDVVLVGWSLGGIFLMKYLNESQTPFTIKALIILAAPFADGSLKEKTGPDCLYFGTDITRLHELQDSIKNIVVGHSKDDFIVPYEHALKYKAVLPEAELVTFEDKNHFLVEELPELLEQIRALG